MNTTMEPRIQYAKTSDGVSIAYTVFGSGPAVVFPSHVWGSIQLYKYRPETFGTIYEGLVSRGWSAITYDGRGCGSSDRDVDDFSLDARLRDLETVIERAAPERFALCGMVQGGPAAVVYTVRNPQRVIGLVLSNTFARGPEWYELVPVMRAFKELTSLAEDEWEFYTLSMASAIVGYSDVRAARQLAEGFRTGMTPSAYMAYREAVEQIDIRDLLPQIVVPTLVVRDKSFTVARVAEVVKRLTPLIPNARFVETDDFSSVLNEFLSEHGDESSTAPRVPSGTAVILFADIADSTALTERLGDAGFRERARELDAALRVVIREHTGTPIEGKLLGDGVLAVFTSARQAIEAALACARSGHVAGLPLHLGLHAGDVIREDDNVYGGAVNIASRISGLSAPGEVLVSETVRSLAQTSARVAFEDRGRRRLKGVGEAVRAWAVTEADR